MHSKIDVYYLMMCHYYKFSIINVQKVQVLYYTSCKTEGINK